MDDARVPPTYSENRLYQQAITQAWLERSDQGITVGPREIGASQDSVAGCGHSTTIGHMLSRSRGERCTLPIQRCVVDGVLAKRLQRRATTSFCHIRFGE